MIRTPSQQSTRPTQSMMRQALFNSIQGVVPESRVLDLFAGSGALGFEALSRGAQQVVFVENNAAALRCIQQNIDDLQVADRTRLISEDLDRAHPEWLKEAPFDLVLADPPYGKGWELKLLQKLPWDQILTPGGVLCLEWSRERPAKNQASKEKSPSEAVDSHPFLVKIREKNYGDSVLTHYKRTAL